MKRLAIFLDGTWNTLNNNTNVWRMKSLTGQTAEQRVYYSQGVGTLRGESLKGGVTGYGIDAEIINAYTWLMENFAEGDEIFIFGFSRGAYTARSLSGLISKCGILKLGAPLSIEQLYERYRQYTDAATITALLNGPAPADNTPLEDRWLVKYSQATPVKFIGVWDTVGSLGFPIASRHASYERYKFLDTHLRLQNQNAFHALALDEHRKNFEATFWTKTTRHGANSAADRPINSVEQRWFIGAHANVGGGYPSDQLAQLPLKWLIDKAAAHGLTFIDTVVIDTLPGIPPIRDSYAEFANGFFHFLSKPFYRPVGTPPEVGSDATTSRINETIDGSVFDRWRQDPSYRPQNLVEWASRKAVDPATLHGAVMAESARTLAP